MQMEAIQQTVVRADTCKYCECWFQLGGFTLLTDVSLASSN